MTLTGHLGSVNKWQRSFDGGVWSDISHTSDTYEESPSLEGIWRYRAEVQNGVCDPVFSDPISIIASYVTIAGTLTGGGSIPCRGSTGDMILSGSLGTIITWQKQLDGGSWLNIPDTEGLTTYSEIPGGGTWKYRVLVQNGGCDEEYSNEITFFVDPCTETFNYTGAEQTWIVPDGVLFIEIQCWGAQGGRGWINGSLSSGSAGLGGYSEGRLAVTPGETLYFYVGGQGGSTAAIGTGGFNGGGTADDSDYDNDDSGGGGGGASDVRRGGNSLSNRKIVAGGGGGGGCSSGNGGAGGGLSGLSGTGSSPGSPGTQVSGYSLGNGQNGHQVSGGVSGAGGGGYYGGYTGTSYYSVGGSGGSGYIGGVTDGSTTANIRSGNGEIIINY